jgi:hypothetical protein
MDRWINICGLEKQTFGKKKPDTAQSHTSGLQKDPFNDANI